MSSASTIKLYDADAYATAFTGKVLACREIAKEGVTLYETVLDQTLFFPEEGGQTPDKGRLGQAQVVDVQIRREESGCEIIYHYLDGAVSVGQTIEGQIDFDHRFSNMQQHSGEHIFSGIVHKEYGFDNVGFHLSDQIVTMDFNGVLSEDQVEDLELEVNRAIYANVPVTTWYPEAEELKALDYRSKKELEGPIRMVRVEGYDLCACCAPHVAHTGEIGIFKVMSLQNYKGGVRISFLCGRRALLALQEKAKILAGLTAMMTTAQENLAENINKLKTANQELKGQVSSLNRELLDREMETLDFTQENIVLFKNGLEGNALRTTVNQLMERCDGFCGVFSGKDETGYTYVVGSKTKDCKELANRMRQTLAAKGGGSDRMIQGSLGAAKEAIMEVINA